MRAIFTVVGFISIATINATFMNNVKLEQSPFGVENVTYGNASIPYTDANMNCQNCIRGGYDFCLFRTFPN